MTRSDQVTTGHLRNIVFGRRGREENPPPTTQTQCGQSVKDPAGRTSVVSDR